jgi:hypothetical protein
MTVSSAQVQEIDAWVADAVTAQDDVARLMGSVKVVIGLVESRLGAYRANREGDVRGALCALADEVDGLCSVAIGLCRVTLRTTSAIRARLGPTLEHLLRTLGRQPMGAAMGTSGVLALELFDQAEQTVMAFEQHVCDVIDSLREAALRRDAPAGVVSAVDHLLRRISQRRPGT